MFNAGQPINQTNLIGEVERGRPRGTDAQKQEKQEKDDHRHILRILNALKVVAPLITALQEREVLKDEEASNKFKAMLGVATQLSQKIMTELGADPLDSKNYWIRNVLERTFCEMIKDQWIKSGSYHLMQVESQWKNLLDMDFPEDWRKDFISMDAEQVLRLTVFKAGALIMKAQNQFDFFRDKDSDLENEIRWIMGYASKEVASWSSEFTSAQDKSSLMNVLTTEFAQIYSLAWMQEAKKKVMHLKTLSAQELEAFKSQHPGGLSLDGVHENFDKNMNRLLKVTKKILPKR